MLRRLPKWIYHRRVFRRCLFGLGGFAALIFLFYAEEDWRGRRDWEQYKREWEAKGERFDFAAFVPPAVPDDRNFALTPIVASTYSEFLDRHGNVIDPPDRNVVDRLDLRLDSPPEWKPWPTNDFTGHWEFGMKTDLKVYQTYYRTPVRTNWPFQERGVGRSRMNLIRGATNEFPISPQPQSPAADVLLALSRYDATIEELRQATRLSYSRFPHNYDDRPILGKIGFSALVPLKQCCGVLRLRAVAELANGQNDKALDDMKLILHLAHSLRNEPFLASQLVRASMINSAIQPLWEGLHDHKWSDPQLADIQQELAQFDFLSDYQIMVRCERATDIDCLDFMERSRSFHQAFAAFFYDPYEEQFETSFDRGFEATKFYLMPKGWFFQNDLAVTRTFQQSLPTDVEAGRRLLGLGIIERTEKAKSANAEHLSLRNFALMFCSGVSLWVQKFAFAQSSLDQARVACALDRYRLAHEEYPATLDLLSTQFIDKLPYDIIDGQPLRYRRAGDGQFLLYSVGWNGTDDGGVVFRNEQFSHMI